MSARVYLTSDLHFDHHNLVDFRNEVHNTDFISTKDMNDPRYINVNIDVNKGYPTSLEDIRSRME